MKLRIKTNDYREFEEFPIVCIKYQLDENGIPVDIAIAGTEQALEQIAEFASIGCNIRELDENDSIFLMEKGATHEALYARLQHFNVLEAKNVIWN